MSQELCTIIVSLKACMFQRIAGRSEAFVIRSGEYHELKVGDQVEISTLGDMPQPDDIPNQLLASTVDSSIMHKFFLSMKGDISEHALGVILLIVGGMTSLLSLVSIFAKKKK